MKYLISTIVGCLALLLLSGMAAAAEENMEPMETSVSCEQEAADMDFESSEDMDNYIVECKMRPGQGGEAEMVDTEAAPEEQSDDSE